jgi:hypothetical protein
MKNLFEPERVREIRERLDRLQPSSERQWGTMAPAQMVEHCSRGLEMALGDKKLPRVPISYVLGWVVKPLAFRDDEPFRRNSPTAQALIVSDAHDLDTERLRLHGLIDRFAAGGPSCCTAHPHAFFGRLTPDEWAILMYKHLDHHLRQFGV